MESGLAIMSKTSLLKQGESKFLVQLILQITKSDMWYLTSYTS